MLLFRVRERVQLRIRVAMPTVVFMTSKGTKVRTLRIDRGIIRPGKEDAVLRASGMMVKALVDAARREAEEDDAVSG